MKKNEVLSKEFSLEVLKIVYKTRFTDDKMNNLVKQNKGSTFFLSSKGHEIIGAVASLCLEKKKDWALPYYRDRAFAIGIGCPLIELFAAFLARDIPTHSGGRMMLDHFSDKERNIPCQSSVVGSQFLQAAGLAKGIKISQKKEEIVYVSAGDGATSQGDFHEALNFSSIHHLPLLFVIQDNSWAISTPSLEQTAHGCSDTFAKGYQNINLQVVDGHDYEKLAEVISLAVTHTKKNESPSLLIVKVPRIEAHTISDDPKKYRDKKTEEEELKRDPLVHLEKWLLMKKYISEKALESLKKEIKEEVKIAADEAEKIPFPKKESATTKLFKENLIEDIDEVSPDAEEIVLMDGINHAISEEMERDKGVVVFGQDVARGKGGVFGVTRDLTYKFGKDRCFNTPLAESTIIGVATGMSFDGVHKPVVEIQFADYCWTGMNQLVNELASIFYRSNGMWNCPVVVRVPSGGYIQGGPYHSQSLEAIFTHIPGLKVVCPSNAADAKRLMKTAIRDPNPVIFLEPKVLYRQKVFCSRKAPSGNSLLSFGKANIVKEGKDITLIAWGTMVVMSLEVAKELEKENISVEVIDLRTLVPLDFETILNSLKKTSKVLIVHESPKSTGFGAELSAKIVEAAFIHLDAPIMRVASKDFPVPFCKDLENEILPQKKDIRDKIVELFRY